VDLVVASGWVGARTEARVQGKLRELTPLLQPRTRHCHSRHRTKVFLPGKAVYPRPAVCLSAVARW